MPKKMPRIMTGVPVLRINSGNILPPSSPVSYQANVSQIDRNFVINVHPTVYVDKLIRSLKLDIDKLKKQISQLKADFRRSPLRRRKAKSK
jgi:hypothetical protein